MIAAAALSLVLALPAPSRQCGQLVAETKIARQEPSAALIGVLFAQALRDEGAVRRASITGEKMIAAFADVLTCFSGPPPAPTPASGTFEP